MFLDFIIYFHISFNLKARLGVNEITFSILEYRTLA